MQLNMTPSAHGKGGIVRFNNINENEIIIPKLNKNITARAIPLIERDVIVPILGLIFVLTLAACCKLHGIPCDAFVLHMVMEDDGDLPNGDYAIQLLVEDLSFDIQCDISENQGHIECESVKCGTTDNPSSIECDLLQLTENWMLIRSGDWRIDIRRLGLFDANEDSLGLRLSIRKEIPLEDSAYVSTRGPESIHVQISMENDVLGENTYNPSYHRNRNFRGKSRQCGYCDEMDPAFETMTLERPFAPEE
jgi:hypothetical protein